MIRDRASLALRRVCNRDHRNGSTNRAVRIVLWSLLINFLILHDQILLPFYSIQKSLNENRHICKLIKHPYIRHYPLSLKSMHNYYFVRCLNYFFITLMSLIWLMSFLLNCGDIQPNPEPLSSTSSSSEASSSSVSLPPYDSHLSIFHLNIQSILPKIDILQYICFHRNLGERRSQR